MTNIILSSEEVDVLGGPAEISVDLDFGPQGQRGSQIFVGNGNPNSSSTEIGQTPEFFDLYIDIEESVPENYLFLYQYMSVAGTSTWVKLFKLIPNTYSKNFELDFVDGEAELSISLASIVPASVASNYSASDFNIQHNIVGGSNPTSSVLTISEIIEQPGGLFELPISLKAIEYDGSSWANVSTLRTVHLFINVV
jgi:hypothetical protein